MTWSGVVWGVGGIHHVMTQNDIGDPLTILNNRDDYDLTNLLNLALGDSIDTNPYIEKSVVLKYYLIL
jgi:hypothetical protein